VVETGFVRCKLQILYKIEYISYFLKIFYYCKIQILQVQRPEKGGICWTDTNKIGKTLFTKSVQRIWYNTIFNTT